MAADGGDGTIIHFPTQDNVVDFECQPNAVDPVNSPPHYVKNGIEAIDLIEHVIHGYPHPAVSYSVGSALKYLCRAPHKGSFLNDLRKARWFLERAITRAEQLGF